MHAFPPTLGVPYVIAYLPHAGPRVIMSATLTHTSSPSFPAQHGTRLPLPPRPGKTQDGPRRLPRYAPSPGASFRTYLSAADSPLHPTRRSLIRLQLENTSLGTEIVSLRTRVTQLETQVAAKTVENARLGTEHSEISRAWLDVVQGEEGVRREVEEEKARMKKSEREWMGRLKASEEARYAVQARLESVERDRERERDESSNKEEMWALQMRQKEQQVDALRDVEAKVRELEDQLEAKDRQLEDVRSLLSDRPPPTSDDPTAHLRAELKRQSTLLATLEKTNVQLSRECVDLRLRRDNVESLEKEVKALAKRAQVAEDKLAVVYEQLDQSRRELEYVPPSPPRWPALIPHSSLTMTVPPITEDENPTLSLNDALSLRHKYTTLATAHSSCASRIAQLSSGNVELAERLREVSREGTRRIAELEERVETGEREVRWAAGAREAAERRLRLAREELELLRRVGPLRVGVGSC